MPITVILVDDHAVLRDGMRALLDANTNVKVVGAAANGRDAIVLSRELTPDVVVMDITMPQLNGIDATVEILRDSPGTRIVVLSMHVDSEHVCLALKAGARGYLSKESAGHLVCEAVETVATGQRYLCPHTSRVMIDDYVSVPGSDGHVSPLDQLSSRERQVLQLVVEGRTSARIAKTLSLSPKTVETYRHRIMQKLDIGDLPALVRFAIRQGLTPLDL
ncbi:MAG: response regulator transcription factor [Lentisphaerae bacterium]|nr:response regulator transcription factor [Lentisphaerota bacterium]MBT5613227.1 response regulator transcription factor [Lentisphaerota bacterium]MBT7062110.1 response regulator transcription factor [Lentisphaerota bacterium]MBT7847622.1 response regulator transcription factor [Lentisphaerota bacterium]